MVGFPRLPYLIPLWLEAVRTSQSERLTPQDPYLERGVTSRKTGGGVEGK